MDCRVDEESLKWRTDRPAEGAVSLIQKRLRSTLSRRAPVPALDSEMDTSAALWYNRSHLSMDSSHHRLPAHGSRLPVLVVEALAKEDVTLQSVSMKISDSGWAWLVSGSNLIVWNIGSDRSRTCSCYELELPPSDLSFRADLVTPIISPRDPDVISVLAVSPEGIVRFWPKVMHDSRFTETIAHELQGQECSNLCPVWRNTCLLATTTNSLLLIGVRQNETLFRTLKAPVGVLSGLGKKFTSFIFGGMPVSQSADTKSFIRILPEKEDSGQDFSLVYTMAGSVVQKWQLFTNESELLRAEKDVNHILKDQFVSSIAVTSDPREADVAILDAGLVRDQELLLLVASLVPGDRILFALALFSSANDFFTLTSFNLISDPSALLSVHNEESLLNLKLLLCPERSTVYAYDESRIFFIRSNTVVDSIDFDGNEDGILGAGVHDKIPIIFSHKEGLLTISGSVVDQIDSSSICDSSHKLMPQSDSDISDKIRNAIRLISANEKDQAIAGINDSQDTGSDPHHMAHAVLRFATEIADGHVSTESVMWDERFKGNKTPRSFSSQDILVTRQLEEKITAVTAAVVLVDSLPALRDHCIDGLPLALLLNDVLEKLIVARSTKFYRSEYYFLTEPALLATAEERNASNNKNFVHENFFREATRVHELIPALVRFTESKLDPSIMSSDETLQLLLSTSDLIYNIMSDVSSRRSHVSDPLIRFLGKVDSFSSWDSVADGTLSHILRLRSLLENPGCRLASTSDSNKPDREPVFEKMTHLTDIVLSGYWFPLQFLRLGSPNHVTGVANFNELRSSLLRPLLAAGQEEKAIALAEKYMDFDILIEVSERRDDPSFLDKYSVMFASRRFTSHLFDWYMKRGRQEKVIQSPHIFSQMLAGHSDLQWMHQIEENDFPAAAQTLRLLAASETVDLRKKTILSLCKLAELASPHTCRISDVDNLLEEVNFRTA